MVSIPGLAADSSVTEAGAEEATIGSRVDEVIAVYAGPIAERRPQAIAV